MTSAVETHAHVIVGAGSAGLATGALLRRAGFEPLVLEAGPEPGAAWRERYDRLRLHTPRLLSGPPRPAHPAPLRPLGRAGRPASSTSASTPSGDGLDVRTGVRVERIERDGDAWRLDTADGSIRAEHVDRRDGLQRRAVRAGVAGPRRASRASSLHSSDYRNPAPFRGRDVLVVGVGNSGAEIATDVAKAAQRASRLSVRTPPQIVRRATPGIPAQLIGIAIRKLPPHWVDPISKAQRQLSIPDLAAQGLPRPEHGGAHVVHHDGHDAGARRRDRRAVRHGRVEVVAAVESSTARTCCSPTGRASTRTS